MELFGTLTGIVLAAWLAYLFGKRHSVLHSRAQRRLVWLEKAQAALLAAAGDLNNARAGDIAKVRDEEGRAHWDHALLSIGRLRELEIEAEAYLPNSSAEAVREAVGDILSLAGVAGKLSPVSRGRDTDHLFEIVTKLLYHAASRVAGEIRAEMGLDELKREWRLYDAEIRSLRSELESQGDSAAAAEEVLEDGTSLD